MGSCPKCGNPNMRKHKCQHCGPHVPAIETLEYVNAQMEHVSYIAKKKAKDHEQDPVPSA